MRNGEGLSMEQVIAFIENAPANIFLKTPPVDTEQFPRLAPSSTGKKTSISSEKPMSRFGPIMKWANVTT